MANTTDVAAMFGANNENVDYTEAARAGCSLLPMPAEDDGLEVLARKMRALAEVVESGKSIAVATDFCNPESLVRAQMRPQESSQYDAWKGGIRMPVFDFDANKAPVKGGDKVQKRLAHRTIAMNTIWRVDRATAENAMWLWINWPYAIPLVKAVAKVQRAKNHWKKIVEGQDVLSEMEMAEVLTTSKAIAVSSNTVDHVLRRLNEVMDDLIQAMETIQAREHALSLVRYSNADSSL